MKKKVSIIIPVFNSEFFLPKTLESVLKQTYLNWECIIIDDGSIDNTAFIVEKFCNIDSRFKYLKRKSKKKGPGSCRNTGIQEASGDYIIFLDSDDFLVNTCLMKRIDYLEKYPKFDVWVFKMRVKNQNEELKDICNIYPRDVQNINEYIKLFLSSISPFTVTCPIWKTNILKELKGFNEELLRFEDPELHLRALMSGFKFRVNDKADADCYYYKGKVYKSKFKKKKMIRVVIANYFKFNKICLNYSFKNISTEEKKKLLRRSLNLFLNDYLLKLRNNNYYFFKIILRFKVYRVLDIKTFINLLIFQILINFGFSNKHLGYFKLKKNVSQFLLKK